MRGGTDLDRLHPGYFVPTEAVGLVASAGAAEVGQHRFAQVMLGLRLICSIVGSMILVRLIFRPPLPEALLPTMAIEVAPAAVPSVAYLYITGGRVDMFAAILAGYGLLMVTAQLPLLPRDRRRRCSLGTWSFTFSWSAVASTVLLGIAWVYPMGGRVYSYLTPVAGAGPLHLRARERSEHDTTFAASTMPRSSGLSRRSHRNRPSNP
jgi:tellurite resistance protein